MNDRQTLLITGPRLDDGMALLSLLWDANVDLVAEVIPLADLPHQLRHPHPQFLIVTGWEPEHLPSLAHLLTTESPLSEHAHVILLDYVRSPSIPATWECLPTPHLPALLQQVLGAAPVVRGASHNAQKDPVVGE